MNDETSATEADAVGGRTLSRRTVLRTAAHAAWAVPVISAVSAAPAFAANSNTLTLESSASIPNSRNHIDVTVLLTNDTGGTLSAAGVLVQFTEVSRAVDAVSIQASSPAGQWTVATGPALYQVTCGAISDDGGQAQVTVRFSFASKPAKGTEVTVFGTVSAAGFEVVPIAAFSETATA